MSRRDDPTPSAQLLARYRAGDERAAEAIFERYVERLTRLARSRLATRLAARVDPEDIVMSAYRSFFVAARQGRFELHRGGDLWRLLVEVTLHKLYRQAARNQAQRRSVGREQPSTESLWLRVAGSEPTPEQAALAVEEVELLLANLPERGRRAVELRLQGYEQREIAARLNCTDRTIRRWLDRAKELLDGSRQRAGSSPKPSAAVAPARPARRRKRAFDSAGLRWRDLVLQEQIGAGSTGKVYRALDRTTGGEVAVKFLRKALVGEAAIVERFLQEAQTVAALSHPGIVPVQGIGRTPGGGYFLVMQLVRGRDLHAVCQAGPVAPRQAADWVAAAAGILQFAHDRGIIHCDLKPGNLLLDERGDIRVTDFGFAVRLADEAPAALLAGTPAFMAPEQVDRCWGPLSPRTDVWGLGAVLYFLLFRRPPHQGRDVADTLARVVSGQPVAFPQRKSTALADVCRHCLSKSPSERFATAQEVAAALSLAPTV